VRISSQSRQTARTVLTKRSAIAFAFGARTGVFTIRMPSAAEDLVERAAALAVPVADQEAHTCAFSQRRCPTDPTRRLDARSNRVLRLAELCVYRLGRGAKGHGNHS
jgi:hypothetical protein